MPNGIEVPHPPPAGFWRPTVNLVSSSRGWGVHTGHFRRILDPLLFMSRRRRKGKTLRSAPWVPIEDAVRHKRVEVEVRIQGIAKALLEESGPAGVIAPGPPAPGSHGAGRGNALPHAAVDRWIGTISWILESDSGDCVNLAGVGEFTQGIFVPLRNTLAGKPWRKPIAGASSFRYSFLAAHLNTQGEKRLGFPWRQIAALVAGGWCHPSSS